MKLYVIVLLVLVSLSVTGCAGGPLAPKQTATAAPDKGVTAAPSKSATEAPQTGTIVEYRRSGGFAGVNDYLVIDASGDARLTRKNGETSLSLTQDEVGQLTVMLEQSGFTKLESNYTPGGTGADRFEYEITYKGHTVHTMEGAAPATLTPVLGRLNELLAKSQVSK